MENATRVLFLASDPFHDDAPLRLAEEVLAVGHAIRGVRERVELVPCYAPRTRDLQGALLRHDPRIVHFAGHGGAIRLGDAQGRRGVVGTEALAKLFGILSEWIKVVILNGRGTVPVADALGDVVDYAIAMDQPLGAPAATAFAGAFYGALGTGMTVRASFELAASRLALQEAATPVLRIRPGVDPSVPLLADPAGAPSPPRARAARRWSRRTPAR